MSKTEKFVQWSSFVAYCLAGFSILAAPELYHIILKLEYKGRSEGYVRLVGLGIMDIGFVFIIVARSNVRVHRYGTILASVVSRFIWVTATGLMLILREMVPVAFAVLFMVLDILLSLSTLFIWCWETEEPLRRAFLKELLGLFQGCRGVKTGGPMTVMFITDLIQTFFWYVLVVRPDFAQKIFVLDPFDGFAGGYLAAFFYLVSIHGLYHVLCANNLNLPFASASVCYRVFLNIPVTLVLFLVDQIERNLFLTIMSFDLFISIVFLVFMLRERRPIENATEDEQEDQ